MADSDKKPDPADGNQPDSDGNYAGEVEALLSQASQLADSAASQLGDGDERPRQPPPAEIDSLSEGHAVVEQQLDDVSRLVAEANREAADWAATPDESDTEDAASPDADPVNSVNVDETTGDSAPETATEAVENMPDANSDADGDADIGGDTDITDAGDPSAEAVAHTDDAAPETDESPLHAVDASGEIAQPHDLSDVQTETDHDEASVATLETTELLPEQDLDDGLANAVIGHDGELNYVTDASELDNIPMIDLSAAPAGGDTGGELVAPGGRLDRLRARLAANAPGRAVLAVCGPLGRLSLTVLQVINRPFDRFGDTLRTYVGVVAIATAILAVITWLLPMLARG